MINNLIANIKAQLGTESNMDEFVAEKYAGSEVAEELLALDDIDNIEAGMESATESIVGFGLMEQEAALESQGLELTQFNRYEGSLGNESLVNMAKRGGYNIVIAIKKAVSKIWKFFMSIIDFFIICDGRWKSYSKLAKKYREKMNRLKAHTGEKEADKTYSIRNVAEATNFVESIINGMNSFKRVQPSGDTATAYAESVCGAIVAVMIDFMYAANPKVKLEEELLKSHPDTAKERFAEAKEELMEGIKTIRESDDVAVDAAKSALLTALSKIETATKKDIRWFKEYKKMSKDVDKAIEKLGKDKDSITDEQHQYLLTQLGSMSQGLVEFKKVANLSMKNVGSCIQMVLADAAKVIAGETRIGD